MKIGKIIKWLFFAFLAVFFAFILIRIFMMDESRTLKDIYPTENAISAFKQAGDDAFTYHDTADKICSDGYFMAYGFVYAEKTREAQLTVKYNDSLTSMYLEGADPDKFRWELSDADGNTVAVGKVLDTAEKYQYNYIRLSFEGVEFGGGDELNLRLVCEELEYPREGEDPHLTVHEAGMKLKKYKLSSDEKKSLS